jgi:hypothetical protein
VLEVDALTETLGLDELLDKEDKELLDKLLTEVDTLIEVVLEGVLLLDEEDEELEDKLLSDAGVELDL